MPTEVKDISITRPAFPHAELADYELFWRNNYEWLKSRGYVLRARYEPNWKPSWEGTGKSWHKCEDAFRIWFSLNDAIRISDGTIVALKQIDERIHPHEADIAQSFSSEPFASDPTNHCTPVYEVLRNPDDQEHVLLVMPFLRRFDDPRFDTFGEAVECFRQLFEGIQFMHKNNVAHRDCTLLNLMMDAAPLYPEPYHPVKTYMKRDFSGEAKHFTRTQRPVHYYWVDFGLSRRYNPQDGTPMEAPIWGGDKTVPEFQISNEPRNPFPTDIYYLGSLIRETFIQEKIGFDFMQPLVADMVQDDPNQRPTIDEVVARFEKIRQGISSWKLRSRVVKSRDSPIPSLYRSITHWYRRVTFIVTRVSPVPKA